jgi:hypothetical protein
MEDGMSEAGWHGKHLTEDEIVADMLARIKADPKALASWKDPDPRALAAAHFTVGMHVRNWYGLWRKDCPLTKGDGTWPPPPEPDDVSARIIDRVREALAEKPRKGR